MATVALTTIDNPYDPFIEFDAWYQFDTAAGYHTSAFLARITKSSDELSETDQDRAVEWAIDEIITENVLGIYRKLKREGDKTIIDVTSKPG